MVKLAFPKTIPFACLLLVVALVPTGGANQFSDVVSVFDFQFMDDWSGRQVSRAEVGDTLTFSFDQGTHSATSVAGTESFDSGLVTHDPAPDADNTYTITLSGPGVTEYRCVLHGTMQGLIIVA